MNDVTNPALSNPEIETALQALDAAKDSWAKTTVSERIALLDQIKDCLMPVSKAWAEKAATKKGLAPNSPLVGEEWLSGPYALMSYCNGLMATLARVKGRNHLKGVPLRELPNGQLAARVVPASIWDHLLLSGVSVDVWMQPGVNRNNLADHTATSYQSMTAPTGKLALVLGAGNIAAIAPLDCLHKLFVDNEAVILKMNPVNDYLIEFLDAALAPLISRNWLRIVRGDASVGAMLCTHPLVETIHITGSGAAHDAIVWGMGQEGVANKRAGSKKNSRPMSSELGGVSPTIVVPGPWSAADIKFQAENVATQKLHNAGFNCVASQVLIMNSQWSLKDAFGKALRHALATSTERPLYYPGTAKRLEKFGGAGSHPPQATNECAYVPFQAGSSADIETEEVFGPALGVTELPGDSAEAFLVNAVQYANQRLPGTLGANIVIDPATRREIGDKRFDEIIASLRYGGIAINTWTGINFLSNQATWGAFPGHTPEDVQSGIGTVHNTLLFEKPERSVAEAPFRPFPRNLLSLSFSMLPNPPWFVSNKKGKIMGELLTEFQYRPSFFKLPRIFFHALQG
jgi:aldehyde dehydrogenase (NAD(P)+)